MKNIGIFLSIAAFLLFIIPKSAFAIVDPLTMQNNKFGIHIFDPNEIDTVSDLVNSNGGEWGYVTVPIRADDRDRKKWNDFMHKAKEKKIIPIVRLASYMTNNGWSKPVPYQDVDFANFLNDLDWPVKNRYIIVYNEPNHAEEWGGDVNPAEYARVLADTARTFKDRNPDFFILPAGLDAAAPNNTTHMNWRRYLMAMQNANPEALHSIDGWNSHSYPNPGFSSSPNARHDHSIASFTYEKQLVENLTGKQLSVFITETGWSNELLSDRTIAAYLETAFGSIWNNSQIIAITPFVLRADTGPFEQFSFFKRDGSPKPQYEVYKSLVKQRGEPMQSDEKIVESDITNHLVLGSSTEATSPLGALLETNTKELQSYATPSGEFEKAKDKIQKIWNWFGLTPLSN